MKGQTHGTDGKRRHPKRETERRIDLNERLLGGLPGLPEPPPLEAFEVDDEFDFVRDELPGHHYVE